MLLLSQSLLDQALKTDPSEPKLLDSLAILTILLITRNDSSGSKYIAYAAKKAVSHLSASRGPRECHGHSSPITAHGSLMWGLRWQVGIFCFCYLRLSLPSSSRRAFLLISPLPFVGRWVAASPLEKRC